MTVITNEQNPNPVYIANYYLTIQCQWTQKNIILVNYNITSVVDLIYHGLVLQVYWYMYMCLCTQIIIDNTWLMYTCTCTVYTDDSTWPLIWCTLSRFYNATPLLTFYSVWIYPTLIFDMIVLGHEFLFWNTSKWNKQIQWKAKIWGYPLSICVYKTVGKVLSISNILGNV